MDEICAFVATTFTRQSGGQPRNVLERRKHHRPSTKNCFSTLLVVSGVQRISRDFAPRGAELQVRTSYCRLHRLLNLLVRFGNGLRGNRHRTFGVW